MDSRLLAGAYSQHYRALEQENILEDSDKIDSIARAKKLSLETNKRRKSQAQKRKIEAQREEKRRNEILTKRREEQKQATEKYQRSHIPPSTRQQNGRRSPRRAGGVVLEDALRLIRGSPRLSRPVSARERVMSPRKENEDPYRRNYFGKPRYQSARPGSGRTTHQIDPQTRAELMDHSLRNLTSSKTLFEQQLEHQQTLLYEQQQQSLREFNSAVRQEIEEDLNNYDGTAEENSRNKPGRAYVDDDNDEDSCSSVDSLEGSGDSASLNDGNWNQDIQHSQNQAHMVAGDQVSSNNVAYELQQKRENIVNQEQKIQQNAHPISNDSNGFYLPFNQDMTVSATYQLPISLSQSHASEQSILSVGSNNINQTPLVITNTEQYKSQQQYQQPNAPLKQFSTDSLESSSSTISAVSGNVQPPANQSKQNSIPTSHMTSQMAWMSPVPTPIPSNQSTTTTTTDNISNNNDSKFEDYNPRYASAISLSIWPGHASSSSGAPSANNSATPPTNTVTNSNNISSNSVRGTSHTPPLTAPSYPAMGILPRSVSIASTYASAKANSDMVLKSGVVGNSMVHQGSNNPALEMNLQDFLYPQVESTRNQENGQQSLSTSKQVYPNTSVALNQNLHTQPPTSMYNTPKYAQTLVQNTTPTNLQTQQSLNNMQLQYQQQVQQQHAQYYQQQHTQQQQTQQQQQQHQQSHSQQQEYKTQQPMPTQQKPPPFPQHQTPSTPSHGPSSFTTTRVPVPAVRTIYPSQRPQVPKSTTPAATPTSSAINYAKTTNDNIKGANTEPNIQANNIKPIEEASLKQQDREDESEYDEPPLIKGILKSTPVVTVPQLSNKHGGHPRDSLEVARMHADKKPKKKSVHFPENYAEETFFEKNEPVNKNIVITNSGIPVYRSGSTPTRPASARVVSTTQKTEIARQARAASAGVVRQQPPQSTKTGQMSSNTPGQDSTMENGATDPGQTGYNNGQFNTSASHHQPSVFPGSSGSTGAAAMNRPKAAAHIIMSSPEHQQHGGDHKGSRSSAVLAHQSHLDSKVKNITSSTMGRGPVRVPSSASTVAVYHVANAGNEHSLQGEPYQQFTSNNNYASNAENNIYRNNNNVSYSNGIPPSGTEQQRPRIRDPSSASKRVPISNSVVTRTSIVPASTKITVPQSNTGAPSYSVSTGGAAVYDENGMRIDRTPTDDEITWLWDKVRTCLNKEEGGEGNGGAGMSSTVPPPGGVRTQSSNGGGVDQGKQPPTLSMKLIDGASLGFGVSSSPGVTNGLRTGSRFFQPLPSPSVQSNKVRPALQQQGSYLRRYGLLKQRRATSATATDRTPIPQQPPQGLQRASSAVNLRQYQQPGVATEQDGPPPMSQAYVPQDGVSESTAAFIMAERLAKQSLSDSHIQSGMQDAQGKQEAHNMRGRLAINRGGQSALSIEEQNLLASLDKLNERLRVTDTDYTGIIHYHQPYQAHLPGFRGGSASATDNRRQTSFSPRVLGQMQGQQRAQSARIRQQTRQYR